MMRAPRWFAGSLRLKVAAVALGTTFIALTLFYGMSALQESRTQRDNLVTHQSAVAEMLASNLSASLVFNDPASATTLLNSVRRIPSVTGAYVLTEGGALFATSRSGLKPRLDRPRLTKLETRFDRDQLEVRAPIDVDTEHVGQLVLITSLGGLRQAMLQRAQIAALLFSAATLVALMAGYWLVGLVIDPINRLSGAITEARRSGDFSKRVQRTTDDELGRLTDDFNALFQQLGENHAALTQSLLDLTQTRDQAEAANVAKSQFLANMSHEIRTPLNGVLGMVQVMEMGELPAEQRERLLTIRESGQNLLQVLNDVLDISKIEAGKLEFMPAPFDVERLARAVVSTFGDSAARKNVNLSFSLAERAGGSWFGDAVRIRQILMNLVSNAIKFTDHGAVTLDIDRDDRGLVFTVADTGIGVPESEVHKLFDKFSQVDESNTRRFGGTGLGLAICRELAELMQGEITVRSTVGTGSSFSMVLPLERVEAVAPVAATARLGAGQELRGRDDRPIRVLAAEDNPTNQKVLAALLAALDLDLTIVENGRLAVDAWRSSPFDLILMDIQMPELGGVEATRMIRADEARQGARPIPIIALSANAMKHQVDEYLGAGMTAHVAKPIDFSALCETIATALDDAEHAAPAETPASAAHG